MRINTSFITTTVVILLLLGFFVVYYMFFYDKFTNMESFVDANTTYKSVGNIDLVGATAAGYPIDATIEECRNKCNASADCTGFFVKKNKCWNKTGSLQQQRTEFCPKVNNAKNGCFAFLKN